MVYNILYHFYIIKPFHVMPNGIFRQNGSIINIMHILLIFLRINIILKYALVFIPIHFKCNLSLIFLGVYIDSFGEHFRFSVGGLWLSFRLGGTHFGSLIHPVIFSSCLELYFWYIFGVSLYLFFICRVYYSLDQ